MVPEATPSENDGPQNAPKKKRAPYIYILSKELAHTAKYLHNIRTRDLQCLFPVLTEYGNMVKIE